MKQKVILLCKYPVVTEGLGVMFRQSPHFVCADVATTADHAYHLARHHGASLLLADPQLLGPALAERPEGLTVVALVCHYVEQAQLAEYAGVVELSFRPRQIDEVLMRAVQTDEPEAAPSSYELSQREREVLVLVAQGMQNKEIADKLCISVHTVMSHRKNIVAKTGIRSVAGLTVYAMVNKLI